VLLVDHDERLVHQPREEVENLGGPQGKAAGEHR